MALCGSLFFCYCFFVVCKAYDESVSTRLHPELGELAASQANRLEQLIDLDRTLFTEKTLFCAWYLIYFFGAPLTLAVMFHLWADKRTLTRATFDHIERYITKHEARLLTR